MQLLTRDLLKLPVPSTILMIRPAAFGYNEQTAVNNFFQTDPGDSEESLQTKAYHEFDNMVKILTDHAVDVIVIEDTKDPPKPDAIFPNNWLSTSPDGILSIFPMYASNRRPEKRDDIIATLQEKFIVKDLHDWSEYEVEGRFLEGTGSMVMDHDHKMIYASISERTSLAVLEKFASAAGYQAIVFLATDRNGNTVYHTNVMMTLGQNFAVVCEEALDEEWELIAVRQLLESTNHDIIPITRDQMHCFAGNMLEVQNKNGEHVLVMSQSAYDSLRKEQKQMLEAYALLLPIPVATIELVEGGSVRCMMAELFLEKRNQPVLP